MGWRVLYFRFALFIFAAERARDLLGREASNDVRYNSAKIAETNASSRAQAHVRAASALSPHLRPEMHKGLWICSGTCTRRGEAEESLCSSRMTAMSRQPLKMRRRDMLEFLLDRARERSRLLALIRL